MLDLKDRVLFNNGISVVSDEIAVQRIIDDGELPEHIKVITSDDSEKYHQKYGVSISFEGSDSDISPDISYDVEEFEEIVSSLSKKRDNISDDLHEQRVKEELEYFLKNNMEYIIVRLHHLISKFKEDNVVWGVGRGSSCACYIFFLLGVHDINPINFNIPFNEFSKE